tara:strand:- start:168 stop:530 length:363 start_codon:yes stop_codon:yes gene_type:complete
MKKNGLKTIVKELQGASKMHLEQSKKIQGHIEDMKSPVNQNMVTGENTDEIQTDERGEYSLVMDETQEGMKAGDTIRPANNKFFKPAVIGKSQGSKDGYLIGGDYDIQKTGDKNFQIQED